MLESLRELQDLKVTALNHRTTHVYACHAEQRNISDFIFSTTAGRQLEILRFAQTNNNVVSF
jgi:hypothetical protein